MNSLKRACVFAHFDPKGVVDPYVILLLHGLKEVTDEIVFVTTSSASLEYLHSLNLPVSKTIARENRGLDFFSWKIGLRELDWCQFDELILCNDSVYGPLYPLGTLFEHMRAKSCDFWGITDNTEFAYHVQSYFLVFRARVIASDVFRKFWAGLELVDQKKQLVLKYEIGLSSDLMALGLKPATAFSSGVRSLLLVGWIASGRVARRLLRSPAAIPDFVGLFRRNARLNKTHYLWKEMLRQKIPFIKVELLRANPENQPIDLVFDELRRRTTYPVEIIDRHISRTEQTVGSGQ